MKKNFLLLLSTAFLLGGQAFAMESNKDSGKSEKKANNSVVVAQGRTLSVPMVTIPLSPSNVMITGLRVGNNEATAEQRSAFIHYLFRLLDTNSHNNDVMQVSQVLRFVNENGLRNLCIAQEGSTTIFNVLLPQLINGAIDALNEVRRDQQLRLIDSVQIGLIGATNDNQEIGRLQINYTRDGLGADIAMSGRLIAPETTTTTTSSSTTTTSSSSNSEQACLDSQSPASKTVAGWGSFLWQYYSQKVAPKAQAVASNVRSVVNRGKNWYTSTREYLNSLRIRTQNGYAATRAKLIAAARGIDTFYNEKKEQAVSGFDRTTSAVSNLFQRNRTLEVKEAEVEKSNEDAASTENTASTIPVSQSNDEENEEREPTEETSKLVAPIRLDIVKKEKE